MSAPALKTKEQPKPSAVAAQSLIAAKGDVVKATALMVERVTKDTLLYHAVMDPLLRQACYDFIRMQCRSQRRAIWNTAQPSAEAERGRITALGEGTRSSLLNFSLPGGKVLRFAKREDVAQAAEFFTTQGRDMAHKGRWLSLIAQHMPAGVMVGKVLTDSRLAELQKEATND